MSEYQRFISYMYEYRNGKKSTNCGYARVENRNRLCRLEIHMKTSPQALEEPLRIYGCFHQDGQLFGVLLGQHAPVLDMVNWRYQSDPDNLNASQIPLSQLEGLILSDGSQIAYCSMWNDTVIDPNQMVPYAKEEPKPTEKPSPERRNDASPVEAASSDSSPADRTKVPAPPQPDAAGSADHSPGDGQKAADSSQADAAGFAGALPENAGNKQSPPQAKETGPADNTAANRENTQSPAAPKGSRRQKNTRPGQTLSAKTNDLPSPAPVPADTIATDKIVSAANADPEDAAADDIVSSGDNSGEQPYTALPDELPLDDTPDNSPSGEQPLADGSCCDTPDSLSPSENTGSSSPAPSSRMPESNLADIALAFQKTQSGQGSAEASVGQTGQPSPWEQVQSTYPQINPFTDDEIQNCVRIELKDLPTLRQNGWRIAGNRFILHSFQKNRHLVLGRLKNSGRYIFAVPGYYDNQERFMANMFGFPYFKSSDGGPLRYGQKGYWYRLLY